MENKDSVYSVLSSVNLSSYIKEKGIHKYISWANAIAILLEYYPESTWSVKEFDGLPYKKTDTGYFVEVGVTVKGITRSQLHPVLDFRNIPIIKPNAFQLNTSIQRALAKAIALHGLGLYLFQGEDLPLSEKEATQNARIELRNLLIEADKYTNENEKVIQTLSYEQLTEKIAQYRE